MPMVALDGAASAVTMSSFGETMQSAFSTMISDLMSFTATLVPVVLPLLGVSIIVAYGIKTFKKITAKA